MTPAPPPADPASPPAPAPQGGETPQRVAAALALLDSMIELYQSGNKRGTWDYDGYKVRLSVVAQARVVTVTAEKG